jgi:predicted TIM-barrel fold metal-dependent hydrolase
MTTSLPAAPSFDVIDCHAHIFPPLAEAAGCGSPEMHLLYQQRAMHVHGNQPYRRTRDNQVSTLRPLWDADDPSEAGRARDAKFRVGRNGRFEWEKDGEGYYVQFLPPSMLDLSCPADYMITQMDYVGIRSIVLQNDHIYGNLGEYFAEAMRQYPGRFIGLANVDEAFAWRDDQLAILERQLATMRGLYFTMTAYFRNGYATLYDDPVYDPFWRKVVAAGWPVFWVHSAKSPLGDYSDEMRIFRRFLDRHPGMKHVLVHGIPTSVFADDQDKLTFPAWMSEVMDNYPVYSEILFPIMWGGKMNFPFARAHRHIRQLYDRFGPDKLVWGSDMPNVERYCTYRQTFSYVWDYCDFLGETDRRKIFRDNTLGLFGAAGSARAAAE